MCLFTLITGRQLLLPVCVSALLGSMIPGHWVSIDCMGQSTTKIKFNENDRTCGAGKPHAAFLRHVTVSVAVGGSHSQQLNQTQNWFSSTYFYTGAQRGRFGMNSIFPVTVNLCHLRHITHGKWLHGWLSESLIVVLYYYFEASKRNDS